MSNKIHKNSEGQQPLCGKVPACVSQQADDWKDVTCKYCLRRKNE
jgi:hypothetical protein